ncbi:hypothetical protein PG993_012583 [Apiospora rasikravindrae]|uniref:SET domain-containing protein n=1 Tax=Apiospora rasikravindrae TaxID=990691 RepID=A0ABR1S465_9PEZI
MNVLDDGRALEAYRQFVQIDVRRQGEIQQDLPSRDELWAWFCKEVEVWRHQSQSGASNIVLQDPYPPCMRPAGSLRSMMISEMTLMSHHRGKMILLRVAAVFSNYKGVRALVKDERGTTIYLRIFRLRHVGQTLPGDTIEKGDVLMLKEPYFYSFNIPSLRVDHENDVVRLAPDDCRVPLRWRTARMKPKQQTQVLHDALKEALDQKRWFDIERHCSDLIVVSDVTADKQYAFLFRSLANLELGRATLALADAKSSESFGQPPLLSIMLQVRALYQLGKYAKCLERLDFAGRFYPEDAEVARHLHRVTTRLHELRSGEYDFRRMYQQAQSPLPLIDCARFSRLVEVRDSPGRRKGLFTAQPVAAGSILLCEKAVAYSCYQGQDNTAPSTLTYVEINKTTVSVPTDVLTDLVQRLRHDEEFVTKFSTLYCGEYKTAPVQLNIPPGSMVDGQLPIDIFHVARVLALNGMSVPKTSKDEFFEGSKRIACGLWPKASFLNHSCLPNCRRSFIGDMLVLRATRDLPAGNELEIGYLGGGPTTIADREKLVHIWGFACHCALCTNVESSRAESLWEKVRKPLDQLDELVPRAELVMDSSRELWARLLMQELAENSDAFRELARIRDQRTQGVSMDLAGLRVVLGYVRYYILREPQSALKDAIGALENLGFRITASLPQEAVNGPHNAAPCFSVKSWGVATGTALDAFLLLGKTYTEMYPASLPAVMGFASKMYSMVVGEDVTAVDYFPPQN